MPEQHPNQPQNDPVTNEYDYLFDPNNTSLVPETPVILELNERQKQIFAPVEDEQGSEVTDKVSSYDHLFEDTTVAIEHGDAAQAIEKAAVRSSGISGRVVAEQSQREAEKTWAERLDPNIRRIIGEIAPEALTASERVKITRKNAQVREALAGYFLYKFQNVIPNLPMRVLQNTEKNMTKPGYAFQKMPGQEYAAVLALSMLDGTFQGDGGDEILMRGATAELGQHRFAARQALGRI